MKLKDATLLLDADHLLPRGEEDEIVIRNPSFEASGSPVGVVTFNQQYGRLGVQQWRTWCQCDRHGSVFGQRIRIGSGYVLFIQGASPWDSSLKVWNLGEPHTLYYYVNARNCCGEVSPPTRWL